MENKIKKMYCFDCAILVGLAALLVFIVTYVLLSLDKVPGSGVVRMAIMASGMLALAFALTGMTTVMFHLRQNSKELYSSEMGVEGIHTNMEKLESEAL